MQKVKRHRKCDALFNTDALISPPLGSLTTTTNIRKSRALKRAREPPGPSGQRPRTSGESLRRSTDFSPELAVIRFFFSSLSLSLSRSRALSSLDILFFFKKRAVCVCVFIYFPVRLSAERENDARRVYKRGRWLVPSISLSLSFSSSFTSFSALSTCVRFTERRSISRTARRSAAGDVYRPFSGDL